jgi:ATP-binding cassette subfamily F protein 3
MAATFLVPAQWRMAQVAQDMPETDQSATEFVIEGDTTLLAAQAEVRAAEATDDGECAWRTPTWPARCRRPRCEARAQALILGLGFKTSELINRSTASPAAGACACNWRAR